MKGITEINRLLNELEAKMNECEEISRQEGFASPDSVEPVGMQAVRAKIKKMHYSAKIEGVHEALSVLGVSINQEKSND